MFDAIHRAGSESKAADAFLRVKTSGTGSSELDDDFAEMKVSLVEKTEEDINEYHG